MIMLIMLSNKQKAAHLPQQHLFFPDAVAVRDRVPHFLCKPYSTASIGLRPGLPMLQTFRTRSNVRISQSHNILKGSEVQNLYVFLKSLVSALSACNCIPHAVQMWNGEKSNHLYLDADVPPAGQPMTLLPSYTNCPLLPILCMPCPPTEKLRKAW